MFRTPSFRILVLILLIPVLVLSGCSALIEPVRKSGIAPTVVISYEKGGVDNPDVFVDPAKFQPALIQALNARDIVKLQGWMTTPFLTGAWRANLANSSPVEALAALYTEQLSGGSQLALVKDVDLKGLLGGKDPLTIPGAEAGVVDAFLVSGWGKDGRDEAILFISREPDNGLKWHGWMQIRGGFSGARLGGIKPYTSVALGFSVYLPNGFQAPTPTANEVVFLGPGQGHPTEDRAGAFIIVEQANGRTAEKIATELSEKTIAEMGPGYTGGTITAMTIDGEPAYAVEALPGQDINRQLFMVHRDLLYWMMFVPDGPQAKAYQQMEDVYAMVVNTWRFIK